MPLDQDAVNLAKAIRQTESQGNFQAKGKSGEYGAYQFLPTTWAEYSKEAGINVPLEQATPEQQNEVAYKKIKQWKDQGLNVGQVASSWNAGPGKPNAYLENHSGVNSQGVAYDTPAYAKKVANAYQQYKAKGGTANSLNQSAQEEPTPGHASLANLGYNLGKIPGELNDIAHHIPGATLGQAVGNSIGALGAALPFALKGNFSAADAALKQTPDEPSMESVVGDTLNAASIPATLAMGGGSSSIIPGTSGLVNSVGGRIANAGLNYGLGGTVSGAGQAMTQNKSAGQVALQAGTTGLVSGLFGAGGQAVGEGISALAGKNNLQKILDKISPNANNTVGKEALAEGRVVEPQSSALFGKAPTKILPSPDDIKAAQVINQHIPQAGDMDVPTLMRSLKDKTEVLAENIKPQLQSIPIDRSVTGRAFDEWSQLKDAQAASDEFVNNNSQLTNGRFQDNFERYLNKLQWDVQNPATGRMEAPSAKSADDIWQTLKDYDASVPNDIKNLKPTASDSKIFRNEMWLQNRTILKNLRDEALKGMDIATQKTFSDMSSMYDAMTNLIKNFTVDKTGSQGLVKKGLIKGAAWLGGALGLGAGGAIAGEHLFGGSPNQ